MRTLWLSPRGGKAISPRAQTAWIAGITVGIAAILAAMFFWMSWHARQIVLADTYVSSSNLALSVEQFVARTVETIDLSLRVAVEEIGAEGARSPAEEQALLAERVRQSPQMTSLMVIGADGNLRFASAHPSKRSVNLAGTRYFTLARESNGLHFSVGDPVMPRVHGKHVIFVSRRLNRPDGSFGGVIAASLNPDYVLRFFYTLNVGQKGIIALESTDASLLVRRPYLDDFVGRNFSSSVLFKGMLPWASSGVFPMRYQSDGLWRIVGYQKVEKLPLVVQVALSRDEALANWSRTTWLQAGAGVLILAILSMMAFGLNRQLQARMLAHSQLRETVRELEDSRIAAEESSRVKSQFMANMSHELRTPLNAIIGFSEVIRDALVGPVAARYKDYARDIHSSGRHLLGLINDVLDLSKIELGRLELHEEPMALAKVVNDCERLISERVRAGNLELAIDLPADLPLLRGDELRLKQVLLNLLSNAVKFTPVGGRITLSARMTAESGIILAVADTGIGMKPEEIPIALEPFRQIDSALNRRYEGTGLGLPLARTLVELHGGMLVISSTPGQGTTVTVALPAARVIRKAA
jgi:two-component system, cell cycle sensor histidine kinase PleC